MFLFVAVAMICMTNSGACAGERDTVTDPVADYALDAGSAFDSENPADVEALKSVRLMRMIYDLNSDGIKDVAVSDSFGGAWGNAGGEWKIYLGTKDGRYIPLKETFFFHPIAINIRRIEKGVSKITIYTRHNAAEGSLSEFRMTGSDIRLIRSKVIRPDDNPADKKEYDRLFSQPNKEPFPEFCMLQDYLEHNKCAWKTGY